MAQVTVNKDRGTCNVKVYPDAPISVQKADALARKTVPGVKYVKSYQKGNGTVVRQYAPTGGK